MERRAFLKNTTKAALLVPILPGSLSAAPTLTYDPEAFFQQLVAANDRQVALLLARQLKRTHERFDGGLPDAHEIATAMGTATMVQHLVSAYIAPTSAYHASKIVRNSLDRAIAFLLRTQHEDGTIDLLSANFHSPPDTAFVVEPLCLAYAKMQGQPGLAGVAADLKKFLLAAGEALVVGGIHTPNHRWVVSMALARLNQLSPDSRYVQRIDRWLMEGIDIDPDGQYHERSINIYSPLTNRCLITIARLLDRPDLLEPVRRNLEMTLYYVHPNGELATEASGRQDKYQVGTLQSYFYSYHLLALHDQNGRFAAMSQFIMHHIGAEKLSHSLAYFQEDRSLLKPLPAAAALPEDYERAFPHSQLVRIRRGSHDATILAANPTFFTFQRGEAVLQGLRLATSFFGVGQFIGKNIEKIGDSYVMNWELTKSYHQPYPEAEIPGDGKWGRLSRKKRAQSEVQHLQCRVQITEQREGFEVLITIDGTAHVPVSVEMAFRKGGTLKGISSVDGNPDAFLLESGFGVYQYGRDRIVFGPGKDRDKAMHRNVQLRGALPKLDALSVYVTGFTPFSYSLKLSSSVW